MDRRSDPAVRAARSAAMMGHPVSAATRAKLSEHFTGRPQNLTPEGREGRARAGRAKKGTTVLSMRGPLHPRWTGDRPAYKAAHEHARRKFQRPEACQICHSPANGRMEWARLTGLITRDRIDWLYLCVSCHRWYDHSANRDLSHG